MTNTLQFQHNFETAHRLPFLGGKCENLHGHSWLVTFTLMAERDSDGITVEYSTVKGAFRNWIDEHLDHGCMLGKDDTLVDALTYESSKCFIFGDDALTQDLLWPTVENVAEMLFRLARMQIENMNYDKIVDVLNVRVQEQAHGAKNASEFFL